MNPTPMSYLKILIASLDSSLSIFEYPYSTDPTQPQSQFFQKRRLSIIQ